LPFFDCLIQMTGVIIDKTIIYLQNTLKNMN
jgi:hypothetical protein